MILKRRANLLPVLALSVLGWHPPARSAEALPSTAGEVDFSRHVRPFFSAYCFECHSNTKKKADVNLERFESAPRMFEERNFWLGVRNMLEHREMPPDKSRQPAESERQTMVAYIDHELAKFDCSGPVNPGRVTIRRLNRAEYRNTIRDLIGVDFDPSADFPLDEVGYGFDNIGDVLSLSPLLLEKYLTAAERIVSQAIIARESDLIPRFRLDGDALKSLSGENVRREDGDEWGFWREGEAVAEYTLAKDGEYLFKIKSYGHQAANEPPKLAVRVDGREVKVLEVHVVEGSPEVYEFRARLDSGRRKVSFAYLNNYSSTGNADPRLNGDRNVFVVSAELLGPMDGPPPSPPPAHLRLIPQRPQSGQEPKLAREYLAAFASRAFRRPAAGDEVERLARLVEMAVNEGHSFEEGMQVAVAAVLVSPQFLFRWELDPGRTGTAENPARRLDDYELASRLSYFLWSSLPDDELRTLAAKGELRQPQVLEAQVRRMIQDPKSSGLVENFAGQWLQVRNFDATPDPDLFPAFDEDLRKAMRTETMMFFEYVMREDRSLLEFVDSGYTFVNERLARHYGLAGVEGAQFRQVALKPENQRGGLLTHGSILTLTSNPTRTSPVNRGKWILEQILGAPPPPPPPNVPPLEEAPKGVDLKASLRTRLEQHRNNPECATCHEKMDPIGFAFENFDATGAWRDKDGGHEIDPSGRLPDGRTFNGAQQLKDILRQDDRFSRALAEKILTFALGRGLEYYDQCTVDSIVEQLKNNDHKFSSLILGVVHSAPFQMRNPNGDKS